MTARALAVAALALTPLLFSATALAVTKDQCVDADTEGQSLRRHGKLSAARERLRVCADATCPGLVRDDCTQRIDEIERAQPTIVFAAHDEAGRDLAAVAVTMDGQPFADRLDGAALPADPGQHDFVFSSEGQPPVTRTIVLREGEKGRREVVVIARPASVAASTSSSAAPPPPPAPSSGAQTTIGLVAGAAGIVAIGVGAVFGVMASSSWSSSQSECASPSDCSNHAQAVSDHDAASTEATVSTVGFALGGALLAGGLVLWLTAPKDTSPEASSEARSIRVAPTVGRRGAGVALGGSF
jgi:hypothetical protein